MSGLTAEKLTLYDTWLGTPNIDSFSIGGAPWKAQFHAFDPARNYFAFLDAEGGQHEWVYDGNNRVHEILYMPLNGQRKLVYSITYTPGGLIDKTVCYDTNGLAIAVTTHSYDKVGRKVRAQTVQWSTGVTLADFQWGYNNRDLVNLIAVNHLGVKTDLVYNARREVISEITSSNGSGLAAPPYTNPPLVPGPGPESIPSPVAQGTATTLPLSVAGRSASYTIDPGGEPHGTDDRSPELGAGSQLREPVDHGDHHRARIPE